MLVTSEVEDTCVSLNLLLRRVQDNTRASKVLVFLDACRHQPVDVAYRLGAPFVSSDSSGGFAESASVSAGLAPVSDWISTSKATRFK